MWAFGVVLLEIVTGFPVWMSIRCKMLTVNGKPKVGEGIFANKNRDTRLIIEAQQNFIKDLSHNLKKMDNYSLTTIPELIDLIEKMVDLNPINRISPKDIINHEFCKNHGTY